MFRPEALNHQRQRLLGTVVLRQSWLTVALSFSTGLVFALLVGVFCTFGFSRQETLKGALLPVGGLIVVRSRAPGVVLEVRAKQGEQVSAEQPLFTLSGELHGEHGQKYDRVNTALGEQAALVGREIQEAEQQTALKQATVERRERELNGQAAQLDEEIALHRRRLALATKISQRFADGAREHTVSEQAADEKVEDALSQQAQLLLLLRNRAALAAERDAIGAQRLELPHLLSRDVDVLREKSAALAKQLAENDADWRWEVGSPRAGRVTLLLAEAGQSVAGGEALAGVAPADAELEAVLFASSRAVGLMRVGMPVQVRFDALPYQQFGQFPGTAYEISRSPLAAGGALDPKQAIGERSSLGIF
jgi:membrane fusion protein